MGSKMKNADPIKALDKAESDFTKLQRKVEQLFKKIMSDSDLKKGLDNRYTGSLQSLSELQSKAKKRSFSSVIDALNGLIVAARKMEPMFRHPDSLSIGIKDEQATGKKVAKVGQEAKQLKIELQKLQTQYRKALDEVARSHMEASTGSKVKEEEALLTLFDPSYKPMKPRKGAIANKNNKGSKMKNAVGKVSYKEEVLKLDKLASALDEQLQIMVGGINKSIAPLAKVSNAAHQIDGVLKTSLREETNKIKASLEKLRGKAHKAVRDATKQTKQKRSKMREEIGNSKGSKIKNAELSSKAKSQYKKDSRDYDKCLIKADEAYAKVMQVSKEPYFRNLESSVLSEWKKGARILDGVINVVENNAPQPEDYAYMNSKGSTMQNGKKVYFEEIKVGDKFTKDGNEWVKKSTRTAYSKKYDRTFNFGKKDVCVKNSKEDSNVIPFKPTAY